MSVPGIAQRGGRQTAPALAKTQRRLVGAYARSVPDIAYGAWAGRSARAMSVSGTAQQARREIAEREVTRRRDSRRAVIAVTPPTLLSLPLLPCTPPSLLPLLHTLIDPPLPPPPAPELFTAPRKIRPASLLLSPPPSPLLPPLPLQRRPTLLRAPYSKSLPEIA
eukprot:3396526-Rhodomonas_salina.1